MTIRNSFDLFRFPFLFQTQNVIITNPSSNIIQYSVELTSTYENKKTKKQGNSMNNNQIFDIATVCMNK
jgi:hypothetical protein